MDSNGLNRIFANKEIIEKGWGTSLLPQLVLISSVKLISRSILLKDFLHFVMENLGTFNCLVLTEYELIVVFAP